MLQQSVERLSVALARAGDSTNAKARRVPGLLCLFSASILANGAKLKCHFLKGIIANQESELGKDWRGDGLDRIFAREENSYLRCWRGSWPTNGRVGADGRNELDGRVTGISARSQDWV